MSEERERLSRAVVDIVLEHSHEGASEAEAARRGGLPEEAFYAYFESFDQAAVEIYRRNTTEFNGLVLGAYEGGNGWRNSLRAAAYAAARHIRDNPRWVRFGTRAGMMYIAVRPYLGAEIAAEELTMPAPPGSGHRPERGPLSSAYELSHCQLRDRRP
jgi:AcrR family transcriptional regulator